jgi:ankyrin repeat protein
MRDQILQQDFIDWEGRPTERLYYVSGLPFHDMMSRDEAIDLLRLLIAQGADVNRRNPANGETPLHGAVSYGEVEMTRLLLDAGADINPAGGVIENGTPLLLAVFFGMLDCARLLVSRGALVNDLAVAAGLGDMVAIKHLMDGNKQRALAFASINGQQAAADILLREGAEINATAYQDLTALHCAAYRNQPQMATFLLMRGADATIRDPNHDATPLQWAAYHHHEAVYNAIDHYLKGKQT